MMFELEKTGDVGVVTLNVEALDGSNAKQFKEEIGRVVDTHPRMVFDLEQVRFVDSSGLGAILSALRRLNAVGGDLRLCGVTPPVRALLEMVRMHKIVDIFDRREDAAGSWTD